MTERSNHRGSNPIGVVSHSGKFAAQCSINGKQTYLGFYQTAEEAHKVWLNCKIELAYKLAEAQTDPRVAKALIYRYENYHTTLEIIVNESS